MELADLAARIGETLGTSDWILVDQALIDTFAEVSGDHQYIHVDPERAAGTPFGGTIAHGFLTVSLLSQMMASARERAKATMDVRMSVNYGFDKLRFLSPVRSGKRIRGHFKLLEMDEKRPGQWQQKVEATVEIEGEDIANGGRPALIAEWLFQHFT